MLKNNMLEYKFYGWYFERIKKNKINLPDRFSTLLVGKAIHIVVVKDKFLILLPSDEFTKEKIEREIEEISKINCDEKFIYLITNWVY